MDKEDVVYKIGEQEMKVVRETAAAGYKAERRFTYEDYCTWPDDERWELIDGIPFRMDAPSEYHQQISVNLLFAIRGYLTGKSCKAYHAPFDVRLHIDGIKDTVVQPDILVICDLDILDRKGAKGAPDLVIEILSPSSVKKDQVLKLAKYEKHGVKEVWLIDPIKKVVSVYLLNELKQYGAPMIYQNDDDMVKATVLADFKISFEHIFTRENVSNNMLFEQGIEQGIAQERLKLKEEKTAEKLKIAQTLINSGVSIDIVADSIGLAEEDILKLKSK